MNQLDKANTVTPTEAPDENFVYLVYGIAPEFMPHIAFRRDKHFKAADMKIIKCPHCRGTFRTVDKTAKIELYRHSAKAKEKYHASLSCFSCRTTVGVLYASA